VEVPATSSPGQTLTFGIDVTSSTNATGLVDLEVYSLNVDGIGWHQSLQHVWDEQSFTAGEQQRLEVDWTVPTDEPTNVHWVKVGVFTAGWGAFYHWNDAAASFLVVPSTTSTTTTIVPATTSPPPTTTAPTTTLPPTTTTTPPPTTTTTTAAPTTTPPPTTTTAPPTTITLPTVTLPTVTLPTVPVPSSTTPPASTVPSGGLMFSEDFASAAAFDQRFDRGWSGQDPATWPLSAGPILSWLGDHDASCGDPMLTSRSITIGAGAAGKGGVFYACLPGGDPAKGHLMTSVNTVGYNIAWFSPKQTFNNVGRVCWDQNLTELGGGKWAQVVLVAKGDADRYGNDLGFVGPGFQDPNGPTTKVIPSVATGGAKLFQGGFEIWRGDDVTGSLGGGVTTADKAARYRHCMVDNENGTVTLSQARPDGKTATATVPGDLPDGEVRVVFQDDNYNPDKHFDGSERAGPNHPYTWHWDNIQIG